MSSWYDHLDKLKTTIEALQDPDSGTTKFPKCTVTVTPAPPTPTDFARIRGNRWQVFLSIAGMDDADNATDPEGSLLCEAHIYVRDGKTTPHGAKIERNRLAAMIAEQIHVIFRDVHQYQIQAATRSWAMGRPERIAVRNLSFVGGDKDSKVPKPDIMGVAHWRITWQPVIESEPLNPDTLATLDTIYYKISGDELGGDNPDSGDDEETRTEHNE